jgi:hypothetical protein
VNTVIYLQFLNRNSYWEAERLLAYQEGFRCMERVMQFDWIYEHIRVIA